MGIPSFLMIKVVCSTPTFVASCCSATVTLTVISPSLVGLPVTSPVLFWMLKSLIDGGARSNVKLRIFESSLSLPLTSSAFALISFAPKLSETDISTSLLATAVP